VVKRDDGLIEPLHSSFIVWPDWSSYHACNFLVARHPECKLGSSSIHAKDNCISNLSSTPYKGQIRYQACKSIIYTYGEDHILGIVESFVI